MNDEFNNIWTGGAVIAGLIALALISLIVFVIVHFLIKWW